LTVFTKEKGRRKKEKGRRKKEERKRKKEEGRVDNWELSILPLSHSPHPPLSFSPLLPSPIANLKSKI
jgi:hypothetical protein